MGLKVIKETSHIINSYILLGILEMNMEKIQFGNLEVNRRDNEYLSASEINNYIYQKFGLEIEDRYINRYKDHPCDWMNSETQEEIIKTDRKRGYKLVNNIPPNSYKDFLATFLVLSQISTDEMKISTEELINKRGEKALSIITKIYLTMKQKNYIKLKTFKDGIFNFGPISFTMNNGKWYLKGMKGREVIDILIIDIESVGH